MKEQRIKKWRWYLGVRREGEQNGREGGKEENEDEFGIIISYLTYLIIMILFNIVL